jgi:hypothetical protein
MSTGLAIFLTLLASTLMRVGIAMQPAFDLPFKVPQIAIEMMACTWIDNRRPMHDCLYPLSHI